MLREFAALLSNNMSLNVVVVDKTLEIAGAGMEPHPAIGCSRWMPVGHRGRQADIMREAIENQSPHIIIVDEISGEEEVRDEMSAWAPSVLPLQLLVVAAGQRRTGAAGKRWNGVERKFDTYTKQ